MDIPDDTGGEHTGSLAIEIRNALKSIQQEHRSLAATIDGINGRVNLLAGIKQVQDSAREEKGAVNRSAAAAPENFALRHDETEVGPPRPSALPAFLDSNNEDKSQQEASSSTASRRTSTTSRIILTTYPGQAGIDPIIMNWGHKDPVQRGPVVVTRSQSTLRRRNGMRFPRTQISNQAL